MDSACFIEDAEHLEQFSENTSCPALALSCRVTWTWSERVNLYNRQIMILLRKTKTYATYSVLGAPSEPLGPDHLRWLLPPLTALPSGDQQRQRASSELLYRPPHALSLQPRSALGISLVSVFTEPLSKDLANATACHASIDR